MRARRRCVLPLSLALFAGLLYANSAPNGFVLDDTVLVRDNPLIQSLAGIPELFLSDYWEPEASVGLYRPLVMSSYALNFALGARQPLGYHLVNIGLHTLVSLLVWALVRRLKGDRLVAAAAAFLFAAHAIHTEAVANVVGRAELLACLLFLLSLLAYTVRQAAPEGRRAALGAACLGTYLLALLSKESAVTLLGVIPLYDLVYGEERSGSLVARIRRLGRSRGRIYAGYALVTLAYLGLRWLALGSAQGLPSPAPIDNPLITLDGPWRALNAIQVALRYLGLLLLPVNLSYDYSYNQLPLLVGLLEPRLWLVLGLCAVLLWALVLSYRVWPDLFFALAFYGVTFSVISNLVLPIGTIMAERLLYLPSVGFCLALALILRRGTERLPVGAGTGRALFLGVMVLLVALQGARTLSRNLDWKSDERLFLHDVELVPRSVKALNNAGKTLQDLGQHPAAIERFEQAIRIEPGYGVPYLNWAYSLSALGRNDEAIALLEERARRDPPDPFLYNNLGFLLLERGRDVERGVALLERANGLRPNDADILDSLGWGYYRLGRLEHARALLQRSLALNDWSASTPSRRDHLERIEGDLRGSGHKDER